MTSALGDPWVAAAPSAARRPERAAGRGERAGRERALGPPRPPPLPGNNLAAAAAPASATSHSAGLPPSRAKVAGPQVVAPLRPPGRGEREPRLMSGTAGGGALRLWVRRSRVPSPFPLGEGMWGSVEGGTPPLAPPQTGGLGVAAGLGTRAPEGARALPAPASPNASGPPARRAAILLTCNLPLVAGPFLALWCPRLFARRLPAGGDGECAGCA